MELISASGAPDDDLQHLRHAARLIHDSDVPRQFFSPTLTCPGLPGKREPLRTDGSAGRTERRKANRLTSIGKLYGPGVDGIFGMRFLVPCHAFDSQSCNIFSHPKPTGPPPWWALSNFAMSLCHLAAETAGDPQERNVSSRRISRNITVFKADTVRIRLLLCLFG